MQEIERVNVEKRLSDMAIYNGVAYLAGQVPDDASLDMQVTCPGFFDPR